MILPWVKKQETKMTRMTLISIWKGLNLGQNADQFYGTNQKREFSRCRIQTAFSISLISSTVHNSSPYVSPTRNSDIIFLLDTFFSIVLLIPLYTTFRNPSIFTPIEDHWNFSRLDRLTLAVSIDDNDTVRIVILLTYTYSLFAYYLLFQFCT